MAQTVRKRFCMDKITDDIINKYLCENKLSFNGFVNKAIISYMRKEMMKSQGLKVKKLKVLSDGKKYKKINIF